MNVERWKECLFLKNNHSFPSAYFLKKETYRKDKLKV